MLFLNSEPITYTEKGCIAEWEAASLPNEFSYKDNRIFLQKIKECPLIGVELEYNDFTYEICEAFDFVADVQQVPYVICNDCTLSADGAEFNLAPLTFRQLNNFVKSLTKHPNYKEVIKRAVHNKTGLHFHLSHSYGFLESASFFKDIRSILLFTILANNSAINNKLCQNYRLFNRPYDYYTRANSVYSMANVFGFLPENRASHILPIYAYNEYDNDCWLTDRTVDLSSISDSDFYKIVIRGEEFNTFVKNSPSFFPYEVARDFPHRGLLWLTTGLARCKPNTVEWRPFRTPRTYGGFNKALTALCLFVRFANTRTDLLVIPGCREVCEQYENEVISIDEFHSQVSDLCLNRLEEIETEFLRFFDARYAKYREVIENLE